MTIKRNLTKENFTPKRSRDIEALVIHSMWGTYAGSIQWFKNPSAGASAHYCISAGGEITQCVLDKDIAWHAGVYDKGKEPAWAKGVNPNAYSIGIELEDKRDRNWHYPQKQRDAFVWLTYHLSHKWDISRDVDHLLLHKNLNPSRRSDPVGAFDLGWVTQRQIEEDTKKKIEWYEREYPMEQKRLIAEKAKVAKKEEELEKVRLEAQRAENDFKVQLEATATESKLNREAYKGLLEWFGQILQSTQDESAVKAAVASLVAVEDVLTKERKTHVMVLTNLRQAKTEIDNLELTIVDLKKKRKEAIGLERPEIRDLVVAIYDYIINKLRRK